MKLPYALGLMLALAPALLPAAAGAQAQTQEVSSVRDELARIRDAAVLESKGDYAGAEAILRGVLAAKPTSLSALLLLEQLTTVQGRLDSLLPCVDRLLAADPRSAMGHHIRARTLAALDREADLEQAGEAWIAAMPKLETPYRELAQLWRERRQPQRALELLERGRKRIGVPGALALELGDTWWALGETKRAVAEWDRAIGAGGQGFQLVQRRLRALPDGGARVVPSLLNALLREPSSLARQRNALQLALEAGLSRDAERIARPLLAALPAREREPFLADVARRADGADLVRVAYWAYDELIRLAEADTVRLLALRTRLAQLALAVGDTARAAEAFAALEQASAHDSPQRRQAIAVRIRLTAKNGDARAAAAELAQFRGEFPDAPELDETAAAVAEALLAAGELDAAEQAVLSVRGPRSALARGRSYLRRGDVQHALAELKTAAPALRGQEATRTIALTATLTRISPAAGELLGQALSETREDAAGAVALLVERSRGLPDRERGVVLDFAAGLADDGGLTDAAEAVRHELVEKHPSSEAAPAALLWLARRAGRSAEQQEKARLLLEKLILDYPRSALVPHARRELDSMAGRNPAVPAGRKAGEQ